MRDFKSSLDWEEPEPIDILYDRLKLFFLKPFIMGLFLFAVFFSIIVITKMVVYFFSSMGKFDFSINDILFAFLGFALGFLFKFFGQIKKEAFK